MSPVLRSRIPKARQIVRHGGINEQTGKLLRQRTDLIVLGLTEE